MLSLDKVFITFVISIINFNSDFFRQKTKHAVSSSQDELRRHQRAHTFLRVTVSLKFEIKNNHILRLLHALKRDTLNLHN